MIESLTRIEDAARRIGGYADEWVPRYLAEELARECDNALSDALQADVDNLRALHERNEAREQRDRLAETLRDIKDRAQDTTIMLHPDADAKGCVDDVLEWSESALATLVNPEPRTLHRHCQP